MILEGDTSVIDAIKEKKRLMDAGEEHSHIRPMFVCGGGCMKGGYSWGAGLALADLGYQNCFHTVAGISVGALTATYFVSGNILETESLPYMESCSKRFVHPWHLFNMFETKYMRSVLEDYPGRGFNAEAVLKNNTRLQIGLSDFQTAEPYLLEPETPEEIYAGLQATISMPGAVSESVHIRGRRYADGASTIPFVREAMYGQSEITHILDVPNQDQNMSTYSYLEAIMLETLYRGRTTKLLRKAANARRKNRKDFFTDIDTRSAIPACRMWGDNSIGSFEIDANKMKQTVDRTRAHWHQLLS